jgi:hypothetical protein
VAALALAIVAVSTLPAAIAFGWWDGPLFADTGMSIDGFGIAAAAMGALAIGVAVSAVRVNRRDHNRSWVESWAIAVSLVAIVMGLILPVTLLCHFKNAGSC